MKQITCPHCADTYPDFDAAHVCSQGPYAPKISMPTVPDNFTKMWADPRFQVLADVIKLLEGSRMWGGQGWSYHPIHPFKYLPVKDQVRKALDDLYKEYGVDCSSY